MVCSRRPASGQILEMLPFAPATRHEQNALPLSVLDRPNAERGGPLECRRGCAPTAWRLSESTERASALLRLCAARLGYSVCLPLLPVHLLAAAGARHFHVVQDTHKPFAGCRANTPL